MIAKYFIFLPSIGKTIMDSILSAFLITFGILFGSATFLSLFLWCVKKCHMPTHIKQEKIIMATPHINYGTYDQTILLPKTIKQCKNKGYVADEIFQHV